MFQTNSMGVMAERSIDSVRPNAYALLTSIAWDITADSPLP
jgi:hypothetical protein